MNFALYSPRAPAAGASRDRGCRDSGSTPRRRRSTEQVPYRPRPARDGSARLPGSCRAAPRSRAAISHSASVGRRAPAQRAIGIRFIIADVANRLGLDDRPEPAERLRPPGAVDLLPVERGLPAAGVRDVPAVGEPQLGPPIAAVLDEREELAVGDRPRGQLEVLEIDPVPRAFVVEAEAVALVADPVQSAGEGLPVHAAASRRRRPSRRPAR